MTLLVFPVTAVAEDKKDEKVETSVIQELNLEITFFESIEKVKEYIEKNNMNYFNLEQTDLIVHLRIKQEYINIDSIKDMGVL